MLHIRASMGERAQMRLTISLVSAWQATPETNAKRVGAFLVKSGKIVFFGLDFDECASYPCQSGGTCTDGIADYTCVCVPGHTGDNCETSILLVILSYRIRVIYLFLDIGECLSVPCQNGGTCIDNINAFTCICVSGYTGELCETSEKKYSFAEV